MIIPAHHINCPSNYKGQGASERAYDRGDHDDDEFMMIDG